MIFFLFFSLFRSFFAYNETVSQHCVYLAQLNYCDQFVVCDSCVIHFVVENSGSMALQGFDFFTSSIFTSFRGSANTRNWIEDFQVSHINSQTKVPRTEHLNAPATQNNPYSYYFYILPIPT